VTVNCDAAAPFSPVASCLACCAFLTCAFPLLPPLLYVLCRAYRPQKYLAGYGKSTCLGMAPLLNSLPSAIIGGEEACRVGLPDWDGPGLCHSPPFARNANGDQLPPPYSPLYLRERIDDGLHTEREKTKTRRKNSTSAKAGLHAAREAPARGLVPPLACLAESFLANMCVQIHCVALWICPLPCSLPCSVGRVVSGGHVCSD